MGNYIIKRKFEHMYQRGANTIPSSESGSFWVESGRHTETLNSHEKRYIVIRKENILKLKGKESLRIFSNSKGINYTNQLFTTKYGLIGNQNLLVKKVFTNTKMV